MAQKEAAVAEIREQYPVGTVVTVDRTDRDDPEPWEAIVTGHGYTEQTKSGLLAEAALGPKVHVSTCYDDYRNPLPWNGMCRASALKPEYIQ